MRNNEKLKELFNWVKDVGYETVKNATRDFKTYRDEDGNVPLNVDFKTLLET